MYEILEEVALKALMEKTEVNARLWSDEFLSLF
jgi:hypothetical protein